MKNLIKIAHRMDDYVCMWNGAEEVLPPKFFFMLIVIYAGAIWSLAASRCCFLHGSMRESNSNYNNGRRRRHEPVTNA